MHVKKNKPILVRVLQAYQTFFFTWNFINRIKQTFLQITISLLADTEQIKIQRRLIDLLKTEERCVTTLITAVQQTIWNQGVTNFSYYYSNYYSQKTIHAKITSAVLRVEGRNQRSVGKVLQVATVISLWFCSSLTSPYL